MKVIEMFTNSLVLFSSGLRLNFLTPCGVRVMTK